MQSNDLVYVPVIADSIAALLGPMLEIWRDEILSGFLCVEEEAFLSNGVKDRLKQAGIIKFYSEDHWRNTEFIGRYICFLSNGAFFYTDFSDAAGVGCARPHANHLARGNLQLYCQTESDLLSEIADPIERRYYETMLEWCKRLL